MTFKVKKKRRVQRKQKGMVVYLTKRKGNLIFTDKTGRKIPVL